MQFGASTLFIRTYQILGSVAFRLNKRELPPMNRNLSSPFTSQSWLAEFQLLMSRRVTLNTTVLVSLGARGTSSNPRRTPKGFASPPSWRY